MNRPGHERVAVATSLAAGALVVDLTRSPAVAAAALVACAVAKRSTMLPDRLEVLGRWRIVRHRTITHALSTGLVICSLPADVGAWAYGQTGAALAWQVGVVLALGMLAGYWAHLLADATTPLGCPLAWPASSRRVHLRRRRVRRRARRRRSARARGVTHRGRRRVAR